MLAHHVLFWLKDDISKAEYKEFEKSLRDLEKINIAQFFHVGTPANIERDVVDGSYSFSLLAFFKNIDDFQDYQKHPQHIDFLNGPNKYSKKVLIYDAD